MEQIISLIVAALIFIAFVFLLGLSVLLFVVLFGLGIAWYGFQLLMQGQVLWGIVLMVVGIVILALPFSLTRRR